MKKPYLLLYDDFPKLLFHAKGYENLKSRYEEKCMDSFGYHPPGICATLEYGDFIKPEISQGSLKQRKHLGALLMK